VRSVLKVEQAFGLELLTESWLKRENKASHQGEEGQRDGKDMKGSNLVQRGALRNEEKQVCCGQPEIKRGGEKKQFKEER